ncbi:MAG: hypothetical protein JWM89_893, partial [Acidimicrobiales bacterium]|nr:hypothetical protein [Acidimicrobiales bacterium]
SPAAAPCFHSSMHSLSHVPVIEVDDAPARRDLDLSRWTVRGAQFGDVSCP